MQSNKMEGLTPLVLLPQAFEIVLIKGHVRLSLFGAVIHVYETKLMRLSKFTTTARIVVFPLGTRQ
jgi:hypothetical protein